MTEENLHSLEKLYQQYIDPIKPLLAEIEAVYEKFPLALYNEIRAMNDHVARAVTATDDIKATDQIQKAFRHVDRITRDCGCVYESFQKLNRKRIIKVLRVWN